MNRGRITHIINNTKTSNIDTVLSLGHDMDYITRHYTMDLAPACTLRLRTSEYERDIADVQGT